MFHIRTEPQPGPAWQAFFRQVWPAYRRWWLREGDQSRPSYLDCRRALGEHMPELLPHWERCVELAGGGDLAARVLSLYDPPPFFAGCSQAALVDQAGPILVRNYDFVPELLERVIVEAHGERGAIVGTSDLLWGLLDGMNAAGLAVSLTFGGRPAQGGGFAVAAVVRYLLHTCGTVEEACAALRRIPIHVSYNITLVDASGRIATVWVAPDRAPVVTASPIATNQQGAPEWASFERTAKSAARERALGEALSEPGLSGESLLARFRTAPLFAEDVERGFATLYTAAYRPWQGSASWILPDGSSLTRSVWSAAAA